MPESFEQLDHNLAHDDDDGAIDVIFMLEEEDWLALREAIPRRPPAWREKCAFILGEGPPAGRPLLQMLLADEDPDVRAQAEEAMVALAEFEGELAQQEAEEREHEDDA